MTRKSVLFAALLLIAAARAFALEQNTLSILGSAWPAPSPARIADIGRGIGVVFSPDLSVRDNCRFYESLGFACFQSADWGAVLDGIFAYNHAHPDTRITTLVLETHGTNGNGSRHGCAFAAWSRGAFAVERGFRYTRSSRR